MRNQGFFAIVENLVSVGYISNTRYVALWYTAWSFSRPPLKYSALSKCITGEHGTVHSASNSWSGAAGSTLQLILFLPWESSLRKFSWIRPSGYPIIASSNELIVSDLHLTSCVPKLLWNTRWGSKGMWWLERWTLLILRSTDKDFNHVNYILRAIQAARRTTRETFRDEVLQVNNKQQEAGLKRRWAELKHPT